MSAELASPNATAANILGRTAPVTPVTPQDLSNIAVAVDAAIDYEKLYRELKAQVDAALSKKRNFIYLTDGYKYSHPAFLAQGTQEIYSYIEPRGHKQFTEVVMAGFQYMLKNYLCGQLFDQADIEEAALDVATATGNPAVFNRAGYQLWLDRHNAHAPIEIKSAPEGMVVPIKNVLSTIRNTDPDLAWTTGNLESFLLQVWYPITVATLSREVKKVVLAYFQETTTLSAEAIEGIIQYILTDFGFRGVSSVESAEIGGMGHLINYKGSDNMAAGRMVKKFYNTDIFYPATIPATEHSIMTQEGEKLELSVIDRVLRKYQSGTVACVMDSFNILRAVTHIATKRKKEVLARNGTFVLRPDSGDPRATLLAIFKILFDNFEYTTNDKGYKVLPPQIRVIQGDGVNYNSIKAIYAALKKAKISAENLYFGMGGKLLQAEIDRDTFNFAFKCSHTIINGVGSTVVKSPTEIDANGNEQVSFKKSKQGYLKLVRGEDGVLYTLTSLDPGFDEAKDELETIFLNGHMVKEYTFEEIRERAAL